MDLRLVNMVVSYLGRMRLSRATGLCGGLLLALWIIWRLCIYDPNSRFGAVREKPVETADPGMSGYDIHRIISSLQDTRPSGCVDGKIHTKATVSIILTFHGTEFSRVQLALAAIAEFTDLALYEEIILIDDGTNDKVITDHAQRFLSQHKFSKVRPYSSDTRQGEAASRFKAARLAEGEVLVFISSGVVVNTGWLESLLDAVRHDDRVIYVPHHDTLADGASFYTADNRLINVFTWPLTVVYKESKESTKNNLLNSPVMRGDIFAVTKTFFDSIGDYDDGFSLGGGHDLELSLRAWLCGGGIKVVLCSRVAVHRSLRPMQITSEVNLRRVSELWLDDYRHLAYKQSGVSPIVPEEEENHLAARRGYLRKLPVCKRISWYLENVMPDLQVPSETMDKFGMLQVENTFCLHSSDDTTSTEVGIALCRTYQYDSTRVFELDRAGSVRTGDRCLTVKADLKVILTQCHQYDDAQKWRFGASGLLRSQDKVTYCLAHVTSRDEMQRSHHSLEMATCRTGERKQTWSFVNF